MAGTDLVLLVLEVFQYTVELDLYRHLGCLNFKVSQRKPCSSFGRSDVLLLKNQDCRKNCGHTREEFNYQRTTPSNEAPSCQWLQCQRLLDHYAL